MSSPPPVRIAVAGALGRMGRAAVDAASAREAVEICGRFDRPGAEGPGLTPRDLLLAHADVVIDFTSATASAELATICAARGAPALVIGSTGFTPETDRAVRDASGNIAIVRAGNFSLGVNLLAGLVRQAAQALAARDYDIEISEAHHRLKRDAPSGTALMLGEAAALGRGVALGEVETRGRDGIAEPRGQGEIGFSVVRGGGVVGEHSVLFLADDEILTLSHSARDRSLFARGALEAALWVAGRAPGLYDMQDVLGLNRT